MRNKNSRLSRVFHFLSLGLLTFVCGFQQALADEFREDRYDLYLGDINGDGYEDVYLKAKDRLMIIAGDISTPIFIPPDISSYSILSNGNVDYAEPVVDESVDVSLLTLDNDRLLQGDFNNDGYEDAFVHVTNLGVDSFTIAGNAKGQTPAILQQHLSDVSNQPLSEMVITVEDINDDGQDDVVIAHYADLVATEDGELVSLAEKYSHPGLPAIVLDSQVGSTAGEFRVDESGSATYNIPIATVAGTAGVAPQISLNYASQSGNGLVGKGWSVSGLSAITRCRQTLFQDMNAQPLKWNEEDRFCLDGQRLILASGTSYGAVDATYKTETDSFAKVTSVGGEAGDPGYFTVERKDGSVSIYGSAVAAKLKAGNNKTLTWAQNEFKDSVGNPIIFEYLNDADGQRIDKIRYAYGASNTSDTYLEFTYQERPDQISGYVAGYEFKTLKLLQDVRSYNDGTLIRQYNLGYLETPNSNVGNKVSKLARIQECRGIYCLPPTNFTWSEDELGFDSSTGSVPVSTESDGAFIGYRPADINGDGYMDMAWFDLDIDSDDTEYRFRYMLSDGNKLQHKTFSNGAAYIEYHEDLNETVKMEAIDYNADGRSDIAVYNSRSNKWKVYLSTPQSNGGWKLASSPITLSGISRYAVFKDFNSDGLIDVLYRSGSGNSFYLRHLTHNPDKGLGSSQYYHFGSAVAMANMPWPNVEKIEFVTVGRVFGRRTVMKRVSGAPEYIHMSPSTVDFNGDGQSDQVISYGAANSFWRHPFGGTRRAISIKWQKRYAMVRKGDGFELYADLSENLPKVVNASDRVKGANPEKDTPKALVYGDINADGLTDVLYPHGSDWKYKLNTGTGFSTPEVVVENISWSSAQPQLTDYNADGYQDIMWTNGGVLKVKAWDGTQFNNTVYVKNVSSGSHLMMDVNGDARPDHVRVKTGQYGKIYFYPNKGANEARNVITQITNGLGNETDISYGSLNHGGHYENLTIGATSDSGRRCTREGCFDFTYSHAEKSAFYTALNSAWQSTLPGGSQTLGVLCPTLEFNGPVYVATNVSSSAPVAGSANAQSSISYYYGEARLHAAGRGFLGFEKVLTVDDQTQIETTTQYRQDWPFIGYPLKTEVRKGNGDLLSRSENTWEIKNFVSEWANDGDTKGDAAEFGTAFIGAVKPYISQSVEQTYQANTITDSSDVAAGALLQTVTTTNTYDDYGNPLTIDVTTINGGDTFTKSTVNVYGSSSYEQEMGRLSRTTVTSSRTVAGVTDSETRTSAFTYYTAGDLKGLLHTEVIEPDNAIYTLTTTHEYDSFGNKIKATQSGTGVTSRYSRSEYDAKGRYVERTYNAYEQLTEKVVTRNEYGAPTQIQNIDGVNTFIYYTQLGHEYQRTSDTGAWSQTVMQFCTMANTNCPSDASYKVTSTAAGGSESAEYFDILGRSVRKASRNFDGGWVYQDTEYDNLGRVSRASTPYEVGFAAYWTVNEYDILGRVRKTTLPDASIGTMTYSGLSTTSTNDKNQNKTETKNALGELVEVVDHLGGKAQYRYDAQGNMVEMKAIGTDLANGVSGTITTTLAYDLLGRKTSMDDPDKGHWEYDYNTFGELIEQRDAKSQKSVMTYDTLGRQKTRKDYKAGNVLEGDTTWTYNNSTNPANGTGLGQVLSAVDNVNGYVKLVNYDTYGRADETVTSLGVNGADGDHYEKVTYDGFGRTLDVFDAARDSNSYTSNGVRNIYNSYGYLHKVVDVETDGSGNPNQTYYEVLEMDAFGNVIQERLGNGYTTTRSYDSKTGRQTNMVATLGANIHTLIDVGSEWDELGNLTKRTQKRYDNTNVLTSDKEETFGYDGLNRLNTATVTGGATLTTTFDSFGNIKTKSDVGTYSYAGVNGGSGGPHAVTNTDDGSTSNNYHYDANGNLTQDDTGRTLSYTSFDKPSLITKGNHQIAFEYGPDRARYKRVDTNVSNNEVTTTLYIGSVEKITKPDGTREFKRYINGVSIVTETYTPVAGGSGSDIIVDNQDANTSHTGSWHVSSAPNAWSGQSVYNDGGKVFTWTPNVTDAGTYKVYAWWTYHQNRSDQVPYTVHHANGSDTVTVNQLDQSQAGQWVLLGTYDFNAGSAGYVELSNPNGQAAADAIKLEPVSAQPSGYQLQSTTEEYLYKDHLGSILLITEQGDGSNAAPVAQGMSFDPWGKRRNDSNWTEYSAAALVSFDHSITTRGFTGHEMLDEVGLIHMNGRIYDPHLARFVQADPFVQDRGDIQMLNRYSYVRNNPLNATDPSGYFVFTLGAIALAAGGVVEGYIAVGLLFGVAGTLDALAQGASFGEALKSGFISGVTAAAFSFAGQHFAGLEASNKAAALAENLKYLDPTSAYMQAAKVGLTTAQTIGKIATHALIGGISSVLQGGKFGHGFASAGITQSFSGSIGKIGGGSKALGPTLTRITAASVLGGTTSKISGGKFANGAITGAFSRALNDESDHSGKNEKYDRWEEARKTPLGEEDSRGVIELFFKGSTKGIDSLTTADRALATNIYYDAYDINFGYLELADALGNPLSKSPYIRTGKSAVSFSELKFKLSLALNPPSTPLESLQRMQPGALTRATISLLYKDQVSQLGRR